MNAQVLDIIANYQARPSIIDRVSSDLIFFGFCLPSTRSESDPQWLIQIYVKDDYGIERTGFANGTRDFNQSWSNRYNLSYKMNANMPDIEFENLYSNRK